MECFSFHKNSSLRRTKYLIIKAGEDHQQQHVGTEHTKQLLEITTRNWYFCCIVHNSGLTFYFTQKEEIIYKEIIL